MSLASLDDLVELLLEVDQTVCVNVPCMHPDSQVAAT